MEAITPQADPLLQQHELEDEMTQMGIEAFRDRMKGAAEKGVNATGGRAYCGQSRRVYGLAQGHGFGRDFRGSARPLDDTRWFPCGAALRCLTFIIGAVLVTSGTFVANLFGWV
ncbi:MAG: hypothetical protein AAGL96_13335 [Pseudomonadota bacterium]